MMITDAEQLAIRAHYAAENAKDDVARESLAFQKLQSKIDRAKTTLESAKRRRGAESLRRLEMLQLEHGIDAALKILSE